MSVYTVIYPLIIKIVSANYHHTEINAMCSHSSCCIQWQWEHHNFI